MDAFYSSDVSDYWFDRGTSGALIDMRFAYYGNGEFLLTLEAKNHY